jgi:hypothetical protein
MTANVVAMVSSPMSVNSCTLWGGTATRTWPNLFTPYTWRVLRAAKGFSYETSSNRSRRKSCFSAMSRRAEIMKA